MSKRQIWDLNSGSPRPESMLWTSQMFCLSYWGAHLGVHLEYLGRFNPELSNSLSCSVFLFLDEVGVPLWVASPRPLYLVDDHGLFILADTLRRLTSDYKVRCQTKSKIFKAFGQEPAPWLLYFSRLSKIYNSQQEEDFLRKRIAVAHYSMLWKGLPLAQP